MGNKAIISPGIMVRNDDVSRRYTALDSRLTVHGNMERGVPRPSEERSPEGSGKPDPVSYHKPAPFCEIHVGVPAKTPPNYP
ncbi:MAG: hypothetical protein L0154_16185 [Chloroflexi bacterium]|nr:hypothetical protein [Chloroflexota bacterium]